MKNNGIKIVIFGITLLIVMSAMNNANGTYVDGTKRSNSLQTVTTVENNTVRIDYIDKNGLITNATNKHYSTIVRTNNGLYQLEEYFDSDGRPVKLSWDQYALLKEFDSDGNAISITYLDIKHEPMMNRYGYCTIKQSFDDKGRVIKERYFDTSKSPTLTKSWGYGCTRNYIDNGKTTIITYFDFNERPMVTEQGFSTKKRTYLSNDEDPKRIFEEFYFDTENQAICLPEGYYGIRQVQDTYGRLIEMEYLDKNGELITNKDGYARLTRTYYDDDSIEYEYYFDEYNNPAKLSEGQYGIHNINGKTIFLNQYGFEIFNIKRSLYNNFVLVVAICLAIVIITCIVGEKTNVILLFLYLLGIFYMTLLFRECSGQRVQLNPFWSYKRFFVDYEIRIDILRNILLFVPLGAIIYKLFNHPRILLIPVLLSVTIELIQYVTGIGLCEIDDVISNSLGGVIGYGIGVQLMPVVAQMKEKKRKGEDRYSNNSSSATWTIIFKAISASLLKKSIEVEESVDWQDIFTESKKQAVSSIVRDGVKKHIPQPLATEWRIYSIQEISYGVQLLEAQKELTKIFDEHGIHHMILKGSAAAAYYPEPYLRSMGDVDFWVSEDQFDTALEILKASDYNGLEGSDERHLKLKKNNILFEMHRHFSSPEVNSRIDDYIEKAEVRRGTIRNSEFWMLPDLENGLVLLAHLCQHLYEGLGLRQVLDWMMYCVHSLNNQESWQKFRTHAKSIGLEKLALVTTRLCVQYFGLDVAWTIAEDDEAADMLLNNIMQSGNFGNSQGTGRTVEKLAIKIRKHGLFSYLQEAGEFNWRDTISYYPYLKPFAWLYQICRYIRQAGNSGHIGRTLKDDLKRSNERYELLKALELL